jgi:precorrin-4 methylase
MHTRCNMMALRDLFILTVVFLLFTGASHVWADPDHKGRGKCYVIGTGPAGPEHATVKAMQCIKEADVIFCSDDVRERFSSYLEGKEYLGNPWGGDFKYKNLETLGPEEKKEYREERFRFWDETVAKIRQQMARGKTVAVLDSGDPCVFGPSHRVAEGLRKDEFEIIPGLGCFQASMAALKTSSIPAYDTRFLMLTAPTFLFGKPEDEAILKDLSKYPITIGLYMALKKADNLMATLRKYYPDDMPAAVVYYAGDPDKEKIIRGTLGTILNDIKVEKENWMGMIIVGRCLEGQPQRGMVKHRTQ